MSFSEFFPKLGGYLPFRGGNVKLNECRAVVSNPLPPPPQSQQFIVRKIGGKTPFFKGCTDCFESNNYCWIKRKPLNLKLIRIIINFKKKKRLRFFTTMDTKVRCQTFTTLNQSQLQFRSSANVIKSLDQYPIYDKSH